MAITSTCALLTGGFDASCEAPVRKFYQQAIIINKTDIDPESIVKSKPAPGQCNYNVQFSLKEDKIGFLFQGPEAGNNFYGSHDKSRSDLGFPQYVHNAQVLIVGVSETSKCILDSLDKGNFVVVLQLTDGTVEVYGLTNGLTTGDYTYNLQEGGGGTPILLSSLEDSPENDLPFVYAPAEGGSANADFDSLFAGPVTP